MRDVLPRVEVRVAEGEQVDLLALFEKRPRAIWLEIGFGGGEHLAEQAKRNPDIGFIGCEPFENGVASLLDHMDRAQLSNVRIFPNDARVLLKALPDSVVDRVFVLFPDPWPKARHAERRFIGPENLESLARVLSVGGELRVATDVAPLADWMREHITTHGAFAPVYDGTQSLEDWVPTRYESKGRAAGRASVYGVYRRFIGDGAPTFNCLYVQSRQSGSFRSG